MTGLPFEARGFWYLEEVLDAVSTTTKERRRVRRWLHAANAIESIPGCGPVVTRVALERSLPWLLDTLRRIAQLETTEDHGRPRRPDPGNLSG